MKTCKCKYSTILHPQLQIQILPKNMKPHPPPYPSNHIKKSSKTKKPKPCSNNPSSFIF